MIVRYSSHPPILPFGFKFDKLGLLNGMTITAVIAATLLELDAIRLIHTVRLALGSVALTALPITPEKVNKKQTRQNNTPRFHLAQSVKLRNLDALTNLRVKTYVSNQGSIKLEPKYPFF